MVQLAYLQGHYAFLSASILFAKVLIVANNHILHLFDVLFQLGYDTFLLNNDLFHLFQISLLPFHFQLDFIELNDYLSHFHLQQLLNLLEFSLESL